MMCGYQRDRAMHYINRSLLEKSVMDSDFSAA